MIFVKAYQAYLQQNYDQCLKFLHEIKQNDTKKRELEAQVYFHKKEFQKAYDIYRDLIEKGAVDRIKEHEENILTIIVCAQLEKPGSLKVKGKDKLPTQDEIIDQVETINLKDPSAHDVFSKPEQSKRGKKRRKRKIRLPKQYDSVAGPDPERWLPRKDRKGNAHKQKKRRQRPGNTNKRRN